MIHCLSGRIIKPELLDSLPYDQAQSSLSDLVRINRRWGGHSTLRHLLSNTVPKEKPFSLLDVGAASGDMGACIRQSYPQARVTSLDLALSHLALCQNPRVSADAFRLPFRSASFDFVFCSLFLHHFRDEDVVELLARFGEVARQAVLVIDLDRHPIAYYFLPWTQWLFGWDPVTVHDGAISVEAAFRAKELEALAHHAGLKRAVARTYWPAFRVAMTASVER